MRVHDGKQVRHSARLPAQSFAEELYYQLEGRARRGEPVKSPTFKWVFEEWKASVSVERKVGSPATYKKELVALFDINQRRRRGFDPC